MAMIASICRCKAIPNVIFSLVTLTMFSVRLPAAETLTIRGTYQTAPASQTRDQQIADLKRIEDRVLPLCLAPGAARNDSLSGYYWDANIELHNRLKQAVREFKSGPDQSYRAVTLISGPAGIGKTFIKRGIYSEEIPDSAIWKFDVRELFEEMTESGLALMKPDIVCGDRVVSNMVSLTSVGRRVLVDKLRNRCAAFVVIDSLDEVHSSDSLFVLKTIEQIAMEGDRRFVHVVVFGRPLAFREYLKHERSNGPPPEVQRFCLHPPQFRTTGDLDVSSWNYVCWKYGLSRVDVEGREEPMTFADFGRWRDSNFRRDGEFANVHCDKNRCFTPEYSDTLDQWSQTERTVLGVIPNLAGNSILREIVQEYLDRGTEFEERAFMDRYLARWLVRSTESGNRPSSEQPEHLDLYKKMLEAVAVKMMRAQRVGSLGYFDVSNDDYIEVEHDGVEVSFPVAQLLDHSGLVTLDPLQPLRQRYRFEPIWVHRLLLEMDGEREHELTAPRVRLRTVAATDSPREP